MNYLKFEDMEVWQLSRKLVSEIYSATNIPVFEKDFCLKNQIRRSSISIISNISEGFERRSNKEFLQFLNIAKGSAGELRSQLYLANDLCYLSKQDFDIMLSQVMIISKSLSGLMKFLNHNIKSKS